MGLLLSQPEASYVKGTDDASSPAEIASYGNGRSKIDQRAD
jgi:hypothetical protein